VRYVRKSIDRQRGGAATERVPNDDIARTQYIDDRFLVAGEGGPFVAKFPVARQVHGHRLMTQLCKLRDQPVETPRTMQATMHKNETQLQTPHRHFIAALSPSDGRAQTYANPRISESQPNNAERA
jgi:hypothetical protein